MGVAPTYSSVTGTWFHYFIFYPKLVPPNGTAPLSYGSKPSVILLYEGGIRWEQFITRTHKPIFLKYRLITVSDARRNGGKLRLRSLCPFRHNPLSRRLQKPRLFNLPMKLNKKLRQAHNWWRMWAMLPRLNIASVMFFWLLLIPQNWKEAAFWKERTSSEVSESRGVSKPQTHSTLCRINQSYRFYLYGHPPETLRIPYRRNGVSFG